MRPLHKSAAVAAAVLSIASIVAAPELRTLVHQLLDLVHRCDLEPVALKIIGLATTIVLLLSHSLTGSGGKSAPPSDAPSDAPSTPSTPSNNGTHP